MRPHKNQEIVFPVQSIGKIEFWQKFLPKTHFDRDLLLKYERE